MEESEIPEDVRTLLVRHIETYEQLEVLLLVSGQPDRSWTPDAISSALGIPDSAAEDAARELGEKGLIRTARGQTDVLTAQATTDPTLSLTIRNLARAYRDNRLEVVRSIAANAIERIRNAALRTFADAFVLGRKK